MLTHKPVNRYLASMDAEIAGAAAPDGASPRRLRTPPRSSTSAIRLSCRRIVDVADQCAASTCSSTIEKYQYGCTFSHIKYSHTGILSSQKFCHSWNVLCDNYFYSGAAAKSHVPGIAFSVEFWYYSQCCDSFQREGGGSMEYVIAFLISVVAGVVSYYLCKWLDGNDT